MDSFARLEKVFREVFDDDALVLAPGTTAHDVPGWDSLSHVNLVLAIEAEFGIAFGPGEAMAFHDVGELLRAVDARRNAGGGGGAR